MRANDFMIGDWVDIFPTYCQILSIGKKGRLYTTEVSNYKVETDIGVFISEEMFHLNGFSEHRDLDGVATYLNEADDYLVELQAYKEGDHWRFRIQRGPEAVVSIKARYVHELQHAMRLMGLHDMANNFKVQEGDNQ